MDMLRLYNHPLQDLNSFNVSAFSKYLVQFDSFQEIQDFCRLGVLGGKPYYVLGDGTNTLFIDNFTGYILQPKLFGITILKETSHGVLIRASAGEKWHDFVSFCVGQGYGGVENLAYIPGTVGAAPVQNIGAYGVEVKEVIDSIEAIEIATGRPRVFDSTTCNFGYRRSIFKEEYRNRYIITSVTFALHKKKKFSPKYKRLQARCANIPLEQLTVQDIFDRVIDLRKQTLPNYHHLGNAGSFFTNPFISHEHYLHLSNRYNLPEVFPDNDSGLVKIPAAWLIDQAGLKGWRQNRVGIYEKNPLVLVNYGGASGKDVLELSRHVQASIRRQFNIDLIPEVNIIP